MRCHKLRKNNCEKSCCQISSKREKCITSTRKDISLSRYSPKVQTAEIRFRKRDWCWLKIKRRLGPKWMQLENWWTPLMIDLRRVTSTTSECKSKLATSPSRSSTENSTRTRLSTASTASAHSTNGRTSLARECNWPKSMRWIEGRASQGGLVGGLPLRIFTLKVHSTELPIVRWRTDLAPVGETRNLCSKTGWVSPWARELFIAREIVLGFPRCKADPNHRAKCTKRKQNLISGRTPSRKVYSGRSISSPGD